MLQAFSGVRRRNELRFRDTVSRGSTASRERLLHA